MSERPAPPPQPGQPSSQDSDTMKKQRELARQSAHQRREPVKGRRMTRSVFRFVPYSVEQDPHTVPTYQAWCVSGDEKGCGEDSAEWLTPHPVEVWMDAHVTATGHRYFRRAFLDNAVYASPDGPAAGQVTEL